MAVASTLRPPPGFRGSRLLHLHLVREVASAAAFVGLAARENIVLAGVGASARSGGGCRPDVLIAPVGTVRRLAVEVQISRCPFAYVRGKTVLYRAAGIDALWISTLPAVCQWATESGAGAALATGRPAPGRGRAVDAVACLAPVGRGATRRGGGEAATVLREIFDDWVAGAWPLDGEASPRRGNGVTPHGAPVLRLLSEVDLGAARP
ncbi:hypothetical protein [Azospirillum sp. sgz301742]